MGATSIAMAGVFAAVIGGMAIGSFWLGKRADRTHRPLRLYALLELGVAILGLTSPWLLQASQPLFDAITALDAAPWMRASARFVLCVVLLAPAAILMGGTLPVMACALRERHRTRGRSIGALYAANTLGGVAGTLLAGFCLIPRLGLAQATRVGALFSLLAAAGAFFARGRRRETVSQVIERGPDVAATRRAVRLYAFSGFLGLAAEIAFTRQLVLVFGSTTYAFTTMLAVFLTGIGIGGAVGARWARQREGHLAHLESVVAATAMLLAVGAIAVYALPGLYLEAFVRWGDSFSQATVTRFLLSAVVLLPGAIGLGVAFPLAVHVTTAGEVGAGTGRLYAANTLASIAGSTAAVFFFVPQLGPHLTVAGIAVIVGLYAASRTRRPFLLLCTLGAALACLPPPERARERLLSGVYFVPEMYASREHGIFEDTWALGADIPFARYGQDSTIAIWRWSGTSNLLIDGKAVATNQVLADDHHLAMLGHAPMLLHPNPQRVVIVGLGMGTTYRAVSLHKPEVLRVVELEREVGHAAEFLGRRPKDLVINDARSYLRATDELFDVITSDPIHPWVRGGGDLYTREYFESCRDRLAPDGIACQWLPLYQMSVRDVKDIVKTFCTVFEQAEAYFGGGDLVLVGKSGGAFLAPRAPTGPVAEAMLDLGTRRLTLLRVAQRPALWAASQDGTVLDDDALRLEFSTPRYVLNQELSKVFRWAHNLWERKQPPFATILRAQIARYEGRWADSDRITAMALRKHPRSRFVARYAGEAALLDAETSARETDFEAAHAYLATARKLLGDDHRLLGVSAIVEEAAGNNEKAKAHVEELLKRWPKSKYLRRWKKNLTK